MTRSSWRRQALLAAAVALIAIVGALIGRWLWSPPRPAAGLQAVLDHGLDLDDGQRHAIAAIRAQYAARHRALHAEMERDNRLIADAIETEPNFGPRAAAAVDRSHVAMGQMQKLVIEEAFRIRAVLRPDQAARYNHAVVEALTGPRR